MYEINENVVYVRGASKGAIYDFNTNKVYSINEQGCKIIEHYIKDMNGVMDLSAESREYLEYLYKLNLIDYSYRVKKYIASEQKIKLEMVWLEITQACNLKCLHCYEGERHIATEKAISLNKWKELIEQLEALKVKRVVVIGGEPCASLYVLEILKTLVRKKIFTTLFTNATLLTDEIIDFIADNNIDVKVSIYGHNAEIHDSITLVKGSFEKMLANINKLIKKGAKVSGAIVIMKENQEYLSNIVDFVKENNIRSNRYDVIRNVFGGTQNKHTCTNESVINGVKRTKANFKITKEKFDKNAKYNSCWNGKLAITDSGDVIPCVFERDMICGNVNYKSIDEIIESDELQYCWGMSWENVEICRDCEYRYACKDCRPLAKSVEGKLYTKNPRCMYNPYTGMWKS